MLRTVFLAIAVALAIAPSANARITVAESLRIADAAWPGHPCAGQVTVRIVEMGDLAGQVWMIDDLSGTKRPQSCDVLIDPSTTRDAVLLCETIVHEVGHLAGHEHSEGGIMGQGEWPACRPKLSARADLVNEIRESLPQRPTPWRVTCGPTSRRMRCLAHSKGARTRVYRAGIARGEWTGFTLLRYLGTAK